MTDELAPEEKSKIVADELLELIESDPVKDEPDDVVCSEDILELEDDDDDEYYYDDDMMDLF